MCAAVRAFLDIGVILAWILENKIVGKFGAERGRFEMYRFSTGCRLFVSLRHKNPGNLFESVLLFLQSKNSCRPSPFPHFTRRRAVLG